MKNKSGCRKCSKKNYPYWRGYPYVRHGLSPFQIKIAESLLRKEANKFLAEHCEPCMTVEIEGQKYRVETGNTYKKVPYLTFPISLKP